MRKTTQNVHLHVDVAESVRRLCLVAGGAGDGNISVMTTVTFHARAKAKRLKAHRFRPGTLRRKRKGKPSGIEADIKGAFFAPHLLLAKRRPRGKACLYSTAADTRGYIRAMLHFRSLSSYRSTGILPRKAIATRRKLEYNNYNVTQCGHIAT